MKTTTVSTLVAALALSFAAGSAMSQEATYDYPTAIVSQKSRAEVVAELRQARAEGSIVQGEASAPRATITTFTPSLTSACAQPRPNPLLAPQTSAHLPLMPKSMNPPILKKARFRLIL